MAFRVAPGLSREIAKFGGGDVAACMNCGTCTVSCPETAQAGGFPRRIIHLLQVGHRERLAASLEPWLCYYCGECSETCPRDANPGETMMAARRYLTAVYDWTGLGRKFYSSPAWEVGAVAVVGALVVALFSLFHGPVVTDRVELNTFAPVKWVELADWIMGFCLGALLLSNAVRMVRFTTGSEGGGNVPLARLLRQAGTFAVNFTSQRKWRECGAERTRWLKHLLLMSAYLTMLVLVVVFLRWFQTDAIVPFYHPTRLLGYAATAVLLYVSADFFIGRLAKRGRVHQFSEPSDWIFLALLFLTALTGILVHVFRLAGLPLSTYATYVVHLAVAAPLLIVEVPFGKWAHMLYRPLAICLAAARGNPNAPADRAARAA